MNAPKEIYIVDAAIGINGTWFETPKPTHNTPYRRLDPDLLIISREELEGMRHPNDGSMAGIAARNTLIDQLLERIGK